MHLCGAHGHLSTDPNMYSGSQLVNNFPDLPRKFRTVRGDVWLAVLGDVVAYKSKITVTADVLRLALFVFCRYFHFAFSSFYLTY